MGCPSLPHRLSTSSNHQNIKLISGGCTGSSLHPQNTFEMFSHHRISARRGERDHGRAKGEATGEAIGDVSNNCVNRLSHHSSQESQKSLRSTVSHLRRHDWFGRNHYLMVHRAGMPRWTVGAKCHVATRRVTVGGRER